MRSFSSLSLALALALAPLAVHAQTVDVDLQAWRVDDLMQGGLIH